MSDKRRFLVVANPIARRGADGIIEALSTNAPSGVEIDVVYTTPDRFQAGELIERCDGCEALVAVGGDGTVADTVTGMAGSDLPLGIVCAGSTNVIARNLGIPTDIAAAARLVFSRPSTRVVDVGVCNERRFLHMGGAGLDSRMFAMTSKWLKRHLGWVAYLQGASQTILAPPVRFCISVDGEELECDSPLVLVANSGSIVRPGIDVHPGIRYDDGLLDVIVFTATSPIEIAATIGRFATRSLERSRFTIHLRGRDIVLATTPPIPLQLDGDVVGDTPGRYSLLPGALEIIVPA